MGYRHYLYLIEKEKVKKVRNMTYEELCKSFPECVEDAGSEDEYFNMHEFHSTPKKKKRGYESGRDREVFAFGKLYWDDTSERIYNTGKPLFKRKKTMEQFSDYIPYVVGKEAVIEAIKIYEEKTINYLREIAENSDKTEEELEKLRKDNPCKNTETATDYIKKKVKDIGFMEKLRKTRPDENRLRMANIDLNAPYIIRDDWSYEYGVFELAHILKTIDWDKYNLLFYGW